MKSITAILGSPRRGNTLLLLERVAQRLRDSGAGDTEIIHLAERDLQPCRGCFRCLSHGVGQCPLNDDLGGILDSIRKADALILAAPVYIMHVPATMKILFDRLAFLCHRPELYRTHAMALSTTGAIGLGKALSYMADVASIWGCRSVVELGVKTPPGCIAEKELPRDIRKRADKAADLFAANIARGDDYPVALKSLIQFRMQRRLFADSAISEIMPEDHRHYSNLVGVIYPVRAPVSPLKRIAAWMVEKAAAPFL